MIEPDATNGLRGVSAGQCQHLRAISPNRVVATRGNVGAAVSARLRETIAVILDLPCGVLGDVTRARTGPIRSRASTSSPATWVPRGYGEGLDGGAEGPFRGVLQPGGCLTTDVTGEAASVALAAVVFTDLVDSTVIRVSLGEQRADQLRRDHDAALERVAERHGGRVVKSTGDGVMVTFASASDAVEAAVGMQQAVHDLHLDWPDVASLAIRVGISVGEVSVEDEDCFGTPVVEAARLEASAGGGEILCADSVRALAGARTTASFTSVGEVVLKGLPSPLAAWRVEWEPAPGHGVPFPASLFSSRLAEFVDRTSEMQVLSDAAGEAAQGRRTSVLVSGEPGQGKTWLVATAATREHANGAIVLAGSCDPMGDVPYEPFVECLGQWAASTPAEEIRQVLGADLPTLAPLVPGIAAHVDVTGVGRGAIGDDPATVFEAVRAALDGLAARAPVLVVLDDLHWADAATVRLLGHLVRAPGPARLLLVGIFRDTEVAGRPVEELLRAVAGRDDVRRIRLGGLDEAAVAELLGAADLPVTLASALFRETDGNALFVREVRLRLAELPDVADHTDLSTIGVPEGVRQVIRQRLAQLDPRSAEVLVTAAVVGPAFELAILAAATEPGTDVLGILEEAATARLVDEQDAGRFRFSHALVRDAILDDVLVSRRAHIHRRIATCMEELDDEPTPERIGQLAHHWFAVGDQDGNRRGIEYAIRAGGLACSMLAFDDAEASYRLALDAIGETGDRRLWIDATLGIGEVCRRRGETDAAAAHFESAAVTARILGDAERLARAAVGESTWWVGLAADIERVGPLLEEARDALPPGDSPLRARVLAALQHCVPDAGDAARLGDEAVAMARRTGDLSTVAFTCHARHAGLNARLPDSLDELVRFAVEVQAASRAAQEWELVGDSWFSFMFPHCWQGDLGAARRDNEQLRAFSQPRRWNYGIAYSLLIEAGSALRDGAPDRAEELANEAAVAGASIANVQLAYAALLFAIRHEQRRLEELRPVFEALLAEGRDDPDVANHLAVLAADAEPAEQARPIVDRAVVLRLGHRRLEGDGGWWLAHLAEPAATAASDDVVRALRERLLRYESLWQHELCTLWIGPTDLPLATLSRRLGDLDDAARRVDRAVAALEGSGAVLLDGRARLERARVVAAWGDRALAGKQVEGLLPEWQERGLHRLEAAGRALLASPA